MREFTPEENNKEYTYTCGECTKFSFCYVADNNPKKEACMKIKISNLYPKKEPYKDGTHYRPFNDCNELIETLNKIYKEKTSFEMVEIKLIKPLIWVKSKEPRYRRTYHCF